MEQTFSIIAILLYVYLRKKYVRLYTFLPWFFGVLLMLTALFVILWQPQAAESLANLALSVLLILLIELYISFFKE